MKPLTDTIKHFFQSQHFVIVSTLDEGGAIHCSAKGIVGIKDDRVFLIDLYRAHTYRNINANPTVSITSVDGHRFVGYTLKGKAKIVEQEKIAEHLIAAWEEAVVQRISKRMVQNIQSDAGATHHPESKFPHPQYLMEIDVEQVVDLAPPHLTSQT